MTSPPEVTEPGRAVIYGTGLIGGSVGFALRQAGWYVSGTDQEPGAAFRALERGAIDEVGDDPTATLVVLCTPAQSVAVLARKILAERSGQQDLLVTDVAGIKASICRQIDDDRFIGGHPMAGSEQIGIDGARGDLFLGATWVLTPGANTAPKRYARLLTIVRQLGSQAIALSPEDHDRMVALVSHVPHLVAASLMNGAAEASEGDAALLQLAAGGFRDMTRVAAGDPGIWPDVCIQNSEAILEGLDDLGTRIDQIRQAIASSDRDSIHAVLSRASASRRALPGQVLNPDHLAQVRIPVPDQAGVLAAVTGTASDLGVSVVDVEIAHSVEGDRGVLIMVVSVDDAERYATELRSQSFVCTVQEL
ncbi:MAG: prephenate dehydrogenase/arogenate dehydrogenase family protein [Actinomycetes bacterium]